MYNDIYKLLIDSFPHARVELLEASTNYNTQPMQTMQSFGRPMMVNQGSPETSIRFRLWIDREKMYTADTDLRMSTSKALNGHIRQYNMQMDPMRDGVVIVYEIVISDVGQFIAAVNKELEEKALAEFDKEIEEVLSR